MKIIFWCEFPEKADWNRIEKSLSELNYYTDIYICAKSREEFDNLQKEIRTKCRHIKEINVWPVLSFEEGYWFSGFCSRKSIDKLLEYEGLKIKVDLEPPIPKMNFSTSLLAFYGIYKLFRRAKNKLHLENTIKELAKSSEVISNEFPVPIAVQKRIAGHTDPNKVQNVEINYISYSTFFGLLRPAARLYYTMFAKRRIRKFKGRTMFSIGMLGPGIFGDEPYYKNPSELRKDLEMVKQAGAKKIAIYTIETLAQRKNPFEWLKIIKEYSD